MNKKKLRSIMTLHGDNQGVLAQKIGISYQRMSEKINEKNAEFNQSEINFIINEYGLSAEETKEIFFADEVSKKDAERKVIA